METYQGSQNPLTRKQVKENIFTYIQEPGPTIQIEGANINKRYGDIKAFVEVPVISRFKPLKIQAANTDELQLLIKTSMGNSVCHFNNEELDRVYNFDNCSNQEYKEVIKLYLKGGLQDNNSPIDQFSLLEYSETIYPRQLYTNKNYTRQRTTFVFDWKDSRLDRTEEDVDNGFGGTVDQSFWPLDSFQGNNWITAQKNSYHRGYNGHNDITINDFNTAGILQNNYSFYHKSAGGASISGRVLSQSLDDYLRPAPIYNRYHTITAKESVVSPNGMVIEDLDDDFDNKSVPSGDAMWEAGTQSGKSPFYNSYDDYVQDVRQKGKGYTIIPEFRISNHISTIVAEGVDKKFPNMFEMTGGLSTADGSDEENFYKIYSTSDFLKHFDLVREDHKDFVEPMKIKLKCKVIKKFLPYNGFYPCQRTVEIAKQFYSSYNEGVTVATGSTLTFKPLSESAKIGFQNLLAPLFAPGTLFNSIKSGVACDYPIHTGSITIDNGRIEFQSNSSGVHDYYLKPTTNSTAIFDKRIPFQALVEPQRFLAQQPIFCSEPHDFANHSSSVFWDGNGDNLYKMMIHNFLAEVPSFFLQGQQFSTIYSKPSSDATVGNAIEGTVYSMRVKMYKTSTGSVPTVTGSGGESYWAQPQYAYDTFENFTMYSRPSAFGPPNRRPAVWPSNRSSDSEIGENYPFTPPYYYGQGWADIKFTAGETKKYTIGEIIRSSSVYYRRYMHENWWPETGSVTAFTNVLTNQYNQDAMQLSASVNLFAQGEIKEVDLLDDSTSDKVKVAVDVSNVDQSRWVIQPYFETPMLNFNHLSASDSVTMPNFGSQSVPRGMWHQYGRIETDTKKGIFLQVSEIPENFRKYASGSVDEESLMKLCGFVDEPKRLGQIAQAKVIREAIVAIPFIEEENERKFFKISRDSVDIVIQTRNEAQGKVGTSIIDMVDKMQRFVIPPSLDFVHRGDVEPFAMYIFEFSETLGQQDLADIWQNLSPSIGRSFAESEASLAHPLLAHELLGGGEQITDGKTQKGSPFPERIKWMVFKAKQRGEANYYNKTVGEVTSRVNQSFDAASIFRPEGVTTDISYNWPYDFFSLVELAKLDAEVTLADPSIKVEEEIVPKASPRLGQRAPGFNDSLTLEEFGKQQAAKKDAKIMQSVLAMGAGTQETADEDTPTTWNFKAGILGATDENNARAMISDQPNMQEIAYYAKTSTHAGWIYKFSGKFVLNNQKTKADAEQHLYTIGFTLGLIEELY